MNFISRTPLVFLCFCGILLCISCTKDSDLFLDYVLLEPEPNPIEDATGEGVEEDEEEGEESEENDSSSNKGDGINLLRNGTFENEDGWYLLNGSTISKGVLTVVANGNVGSNRENWSAEYRNVLSIQYYRTRRFRFTFDARQISGNGELQIGQRNNAAFEQVITSNWATYTFEVDGNVSNAGNDINIGGRDVGDVFEIDNFKMEIIGETSNHNVPQKGGQFSMFSDFEFATYGYEQWGANGKAEQFANQLEVDQGLPRDTSHPSSVVTSGRDGTGTAVWLGEYNNNKSRNELSKDKILDFEHAVSFNMYIQDVVPDDRIIFQLRALASGNQTVNPISIRQETSGGVNKIYFGLCTDPNKVDQFTNGESYNGAGTGTVKYTLDYNYREWNDIVILYKAAFGADYNGPETGPKGHTLSELEDVFGYDPVSDGYIKVYLNGNLVIDHVGTTIYRYQRAGNQIREAITPKFGPYWGGPNDPQGNIYYDNWSIWNGPDATFSIMNPAP